MWGMGMMLAPAFGPWISGLLVDHYDDWRLIFWLGVPFGVSGLIAAVRVLPASEDTRQAKAAFDYAGFTLLSASLTLFLIPLTQGNRVGWDDPAIDYSFVAAALLFAAFIVRELRTRSSMIDLSLFRDRVFSIAIALRSMLGMGYYFSLFLLPLFTQTILGWDPTQAGLILMPAGLAMAVFMPLSGALADYIGARVLVCTGMIIVVIGTFLFARIDIDAHDCRADKHSTRPYRQRIGHTQHGVASRRKPRYRRRTSVFDRTVVQSVRRRRRGAQRIALARNRFSAEIRRNRRTPPSARQRRARVLESASDADGHHTRLRRHVLTRRAVTSTGNSALPVASPSHEVIMFRRVLVPLDPQFQMRRALEVAASFAAEHRAGITLLYITDLSHTFGYGTFTQLDQETIDRYNARIESFLRNAASVLAEFDVIAETRIARGTPVSSAINATAAAIGADAIVMGTHGRKGLAHAWWGSVTEDVMRDATVPVIVIAAAKHAR